MDTDKTQLLLTATDYLLQVLEYALACGNYLNGVSNKGAAWGFKIDSLNKLKDIKSAV